MKITIGENIKRLRINKGVTQEQLSEVLGVACAAVSKWERGATLRMSRHGRRARNRR
ncbi:MAG: helix-turn-helix domain-containing protein [Clostridia bacterium]|nr:helix-turn-helix domain-containing protein [Clostridia bacterium]